MGWNRGLGHAHFINEYDAIPLLLQVYQLIVSLNGLLLNVLLPARIDYLGLPYLLPGNPKTPKPHNSEQQGAPIPSK